MRKLPTLSSDQVLLLSISANIMLALILLIMKFVEIARALGY